MPFAEPEANAVPHSWGEYHLELDPVLTASIRSFLLEHKFTLYTFTLACIALLFHLYSGKPHITVRTFWANRTRPDTEHLIGWLSNNRPLGVDLSRDYPALELLSQVRKSISDASAHDVPAEVLETVMYNAGLLYDNDDIVLTFDQTGDGSVDSVQLRDGVVVETLKIPGVMYGNTLDLEMQVSSHGLLLDGRYDKSTMSEANVRMILGDLIHLIERFVASPRTPIRECASCLSR